MNTTQAIQHKKIDGPKLFVGMIGPASTPASMRRHFEQICAVQVVKIYFSRKSRNHKGFGYVVVDCDADAQRVIGRSHVIDGKPVQVMRYGLEATSLWYEQKEKSIKVKVMNVPLDASELVISNFFERYGRVLVVNIFNEIIQTNFNTNRYAIVEILNTRERIKIKNMHIHSNPTTIHHIHYQEITMKVKSEPLNQQRTVKWQNEVSLLTSSIHYREQTIQPKLVFGDSNEDKHSKYDYIRNSRKSADSHTNYRFNIVFEARRPAPAYSPRLAGFTYIN